VVASVRDWYFSLNFYPSFKFNDSPDWEKKGLARTIAQQPDIVILDDAFSALDRKTVKHIRERLFGPNGLLRLLEITVIETIQDRKFPHSGSSQQKITSDFIFRTLGNDGRPGLPY
jgi:hypothetical protein